MGKKWDDLTDWQSGGNFSKPGIGDRKTAWPSFNSDAANPTCNTCGGRRRGAKKCACNEPDWYVKGEKHDPQTKNKSRNARQQEWHREWLVEAFRVLQPGGVIKAFSATRTWHRLAAAMEEAGFVDIHLEAWTYGSGFPKSKNIALFLDKRAKAIGNRGRAIPMASTHFPGEGKYSADGEKLTSNIVETYEPRTPEAEKWDGFGTAIKPAWEPIVVGRKP